MSPRQHSRRSYFQNRLRLEQLEARNLLAVLFEGFKTIQYEGAGTFSGNTRAQVNVPDDFHDDYSGVVNIAGEVVFSSPTQGVSQNQPVDIGSGTLDGISNCPPQFAVNKAYESDFEALNQVTINGSWISISLTTTFYEYADDPCGPGYVAGETPFDDTFEGTLDISSIPYKVVLNATESGTTVDGFDFRTEGTILVDVTPFARDAIGNDIPFNISVGEMNQFNGYVEFQVNIDGPAQAAPTQTTAITQASLYFAAGPNASDVIGAPIETYPIYWNSEYANIRTTLPIPFPANATHLVVIADGAGALTEATENDNVIAQPLERPGTVYTYTFTATITQVEPNQHEPGQAPIVSVNDVITGAFNYDSTGRFGQAHVPLQGLPLQATEYFDVNWSDFDDDETLDFAIFNETYITEWPEFPWVYTDFYFSGEGIVQDVVPTSLTGLNGTLKIASENVDGNQLGFFVLAEITELTLFATLTGVDGEFTLAEETSAQFDIAGLYDGIDINTITITVPPEHGSLSVNNVTGVVTYFPDANYAGDDSFRYFIIDASGSQSTQADVVITVTEVPEPYQNPAGAFFVNIGDFETTAFDAVLIINELNAGGPRALLPPGPGETITVFFDVNGDNFLAPLDALLVINFLNAGGAGEPPADLFAASSAAVIDEPIATTPTGSMVWDEIDPTPAAMLALLDALDAQAFLSPANTNPLPLLLALADEQRLPGYRDAAVDALLRSNEDWWRQWAT